MFFLLKGPKHRRSSRGCSALCLLTLLLPPSSLSPEHAEAVSELAKLEAPRPWWSSSSFDKRRCCYHGRDEEERFVISLLAPTPQRRWRQKSHKIQPTVHLFTVAFQAGEVRPPYIAPHAPPLLPHPLRLLSQSLSNRSCSVQRIQTIAEANRYNAEASSFLSSFFFLPFFLKTYSPLKTTFSIRCPSNIRLKQWTTSADRATFRRVTPFQFKVLGTCRRPRDGT